MTSPTAPEDHDVCLPAAPGEELDWQARKGRGAVSNRVGRFEAEDRVAVDDGWGTAEAELPPLATTISEDKSRSVIARNTSPDVPFDQSVNPYRGCEHGCIYCFARPTHAYLGLSPGLDFETKLYAKPDVARLLTEELAKPSYKLQPLALGTNTDPYQPLERKMSLTRQILEVLDGCNHPVGIVTKSALVTRDLDILARMAERRLVRVWLSVTTLDRDLARIMEPRASTPSRRIEAIRVLSEAGIPTGVLAAPMIPSLNDHELERILETAHAAGARDGGYILIRLPLEIKDLFQEWLETHVPDRAQRVMSLIRETRGGRLYDSRFGQRQTGTGVYADLLSQRFKRVATRLGLNQRDWRFDLGAFVPPARQKPLGRNKDQNQFSFDI